jgi:hypothetical protein
MDVVKMTNQAMVLAKNHHDLELVSLLAELQTGVIELQKQLEHSREDQPHIVTETEWGHFTSNND